MLLPGGTAACTSLGVCAFHPPWSFPGSRRRRGSSSRHKVVEPNGPRPFIVSGIFAVYIDEGSQEEVLLSGPVCGPGVRSGECECEAGLSIDLYDPECVEIPVFANTEGAIGIALCLVDGDFAGISLDCHDEVASLLCGG